MKWNKVMVLLLGIAVCASSGCATSYRDRMSALETPADDAGGAVADASLISRDEMELTGACIVNADCKSMQHCDLGRCVTRCAADGDCTAGMYCSTRGACVADSSYIDVDPLLKTSRPVDWYVDQRIVRLDPGVNAAPFAIKVAGGGALRYRVEVEPAAARDAVTVSKEEGVVASGGEAALNVAIDRSAFSDDDHRLAVNIITDGGHRTVIYEFSNGLTGRYAGFVDYRDPGVGRMPVVVDLKVNADGSIQGRVLNRGSLLFPKERSISGYYDRVQKNFFLAAFDLHESGGAADPFMRDIGRELYFHGEVSEQRVIKGTFEELLSGLLPQLTTVGGEFYLKRVAVDIGDVADLPEPVMPNFPSAATSYRACGGFSSACNDFTTGFPVNMISCSSELLASAYRLGVDFVGTDTQGKQIVDFGLVEECERDTAGVGTHACVDLDNLWCLHDNQQHYLLSSAAQTSEYGEYFANGMRLQRLHSFIGNDLMVDAYRTVSRQVSSPLATEIALLEESLQRYVDAERVFFEPRNVGIVNRASSAVVAANNFEYLSVPLEYIQSSHAVLARIASLTLRKDMLSGAKRALLRERAQAHARAMYLETVMLARLVKLHGGTFESELAQLADALRSVGHTVAALDAGLNPLGYPVDYVPFVFDPARSQQPTNFAQLAHMASATVQSAVQKAQFADSAADDMEVRTEDIARRITEIEQSFAAQIQQICGIVSLDEIAECGNSGGELAAAFGKIEQQYIEIEKVHQQIADVHHMVKIKNDTTAQIMNLKNNTLVFMESSGAELEALDIAEGEIQAAMLRKQGLFGAIGGFLGGIASIAGGIASAAMPNLSGLGGAVGGIAGGVSGMVNAGLGLASNAQSITGATQLAEVARQKTRIRNLQQMVLKQEEIDTFAVQAAETVKMMLIQMAQLNLDLTLADMRLAELVIAANTLLQRVDMLIHQRDALLTQAVGSVNNPLSNLSFRIRRDHAVLMAANEFEKALARTYLAARGLEHEINVELSPIESQLMQANNARQLQDFLACLEGWYDDYAIAFGSPHQEVTQVSLREDILGFTQSMKDEVSGETITPEEIFRRVLLNPKYITQSGRVEFPFVTSLAGGIKQFSTLVCTDRIKSVRVMLVGDFLGDNEATVMLKQEGNSYLRDCAANPVIGEDLLTTYRLDDRNALIQAGVNSFGLAQPNYELAGRSVASDRWVLTIPTGAEAPNNADVDFLNIDDVVIEITHEARTLNGGTPTNVFSQCNL